ncbi:MAG: hypothetical protein IPL61_34560 [Myxococcales bacterium]|nr:hypothetical protein [Myxococcales bacterium]
MRMTSRSWRAQAVVAVLVAALVAACKDPRRAPVEAPAELAELRGPGWRLRGDVLEDVSAATRLVVPAGWRVLRAHEALDLAGEVAYALAPIGYTAATAADELYLAIDGSPIGAGEPEAHRAALAAKTEDGWTPIGGPQPVAIGGRQFDVQRATFGEPASAERLYTSAIVAQRFVEVVLVYPIDRGDELRPRFAPIVAGLSFLEGARHRALVAELTAAGEAQDLIGADYGYHGGVFRDFAGRFTWRHPRGLWRAHVVSAPSDADPSQRLIASDLDTGTTVYVGAEPWTDSAAAYLEAMRARIGATTIAASGATRLGDVPAQYAELDVDSTVPYRMRVAYGLRDGAALSVVTDNVAAAWVGAGYAEAIEAGFASTPALVAADDGRPYQNWRFGFAVDLPQAWTRDPGPADGRGCLDLVWRGPARLELHVCGADRADETQPAAIARLTDRLAHWGRPTRSQVTVAGVPAQRLNWRDRGRVAEAHVFERGGTLYVLNVNGLDGDRGLDVGRTALTFLD